MLNFDDQRFLRIQSGAVALRQRLDRVIADCLAAGAGNCRLAFDARDVLTSQLIAVLVALGLLALLPVAVKRLKAHRARPKNLG